MIQEPSSIDHVGTWTPLRTQSGAFSCAGGPLPRDISQDVDSGLYSEIVSSWAIDLCLCL